MKLFCGPRLVLLFGFLLLISIPEGNARHRRESNITADLNFPGLIYNIISEPKSAKTPFVISPMGISRVLGLLLLAMERDSAEELIRLLYPNINGSSSDLPARPQILPLQQTAVKELTAVLVHPSVRVFHVFLNYVHEFQALLLRTNFEKEDLEMLDRIAEKSPLDMRRVFSSFFPFNSSNRIVFFNYVQFVGQFEHRLKFDSFHRKENVNSLLTLFEFNEELKTAVVGLRFKNSNALLLLLQPIEERSSLSDLEKALRTVDLRKMRRRLRFKRIDLYLPKINMYSSMNLKEYLIKAGVKTVFNSSRDERRPITKQKRRPIAMQVATQDRLPLDNIRVSTHILMEEYGINFGHNLTRIISYVPEAETTTQAPTTVDPAFVPEERAGVELRMKRFIYAVVDAQQVYLMGRYLKD